MARLRGPFPNTKKDVAPKDGSATPGDQSKGTTKESNGASPSTKRSSTTEGDTKSAQSHADHTSPTSTSGTASPRVSQATAGGPDSPHRSPIRSSSNASKDLSSIEVAHSGQAIPVKGTKADRIREYKKNFPIVHRPVSGSNNDLNCFERSAVASGSIILAPVQEGEDNSGNEEGA
ncbi:hypothetical protein B0T20DRAFT_390717 [Sordaria brevicollis]|uniref:Uncharacterized protein n=1 Tax=Sordaria brevicollis TaxID=83679 RepID=A0AAE0PJW2_SORBR|nr:hypothetical protein B0T20DRAFT_390717 [Sordaria brevicollis]